MAAYPRGLDMVRVACPTTGTAGPYELGAAMAGFLHPGFANDIASVMAAGGRVTALVMSADRLTWELVEGALTNATPWTLSRGVIWTSAGSASPINWSSATHGARTLTIVDVARSKFLPGVELSENLRTLGAAATGFGVALDVSYRRWRLDWQNLVPSTSSILQLVASVNGGASFLNTSGNYVSSFLNGQSTGATGGGAGDTAAKVSPTSTAAHSGWLELDLDTNMLLAMNNTYASGTKNLLVSGWHIPGAAAGAINAVVLQVNAGTIAAGGRLSISKGCRL